MAVTKKAPIWQRIFCGLLCVGALVAMPINMVHSGLHGWHAYISLIIGVYGVYLLGHIALRGRLPGKVSGTDYVRFRSH